MSVISKILIYLHIIINRGFDPEGPSGDLCGEGAKKRKARFTQGFQRFFRLQNLKINGCKDLLNHLHPEPKIWTLAINVILRQGCKK